MSKKHFIALANLIRSDRLAWSEKQIHLLAEFCRKQNERFDMFRWVEYIEGRCGPSGGTVKGAK